MGDQLMKGKKYMKGSKSEDADNDMETEDDEEDGEKGGMKYKAEKSEVTTGDLEKSLDELENLAKGDSADSRKADLLSKAQSGADLSKGERDELFGLLGGEAPADAEPTLSETVSKSMAGDEDLQKALDVSDYLQGQHDALCKSLETLSKSMEASDERQHQFNLVLAGAVAKTGRLLKSLDERLAGIETAPARTPKSAGVPNGAVLNKSFGAGGEDQGEQLSKSEILDRMESLLHKGIDKVGNEDVLMAATRYEGSNQISPAMLEAVKGVSAH